MFFLSPRSTGNFFIQFDLRMFFQMGGSTTNRFLDSNFCVFGLVFGGELFFPVFCIYYPGMYNMNTDYIGISVNKVSCKCNL